MLAGVANAHTVTWYIFNDSRLSKTAKPFLETTAASGNNIGISSITLGEIVYLIEKGRIAAETFTRLAGALESGSTVLAEVPFSLLIVRAMSRVDSSIVPDMPDRIIAATGLHLDVPIISRDAKIQASGLKTIW